MSTQVYQIEDGTYTLLVIPTRWLYRHGQMFPVEGIDANGDLHSMNETNVRSVKIYQFDEPRKGGSRYQLLVG